MNAIVLAIDGPSGAGKSSTSRAIAQRAGWIYLDTGALYRGVTWLALKKGLTSAKDIVKALESSPLLFRTNPEKPELLCGGVDITSAIREEVVTNEVSRVSALPEVRLALLDLQRKIIESAKVGIVVEGRDIGSVVSPSANLKLYLHADINARSARRAAENSVADSTKVAASLNARDVMDSTRAISPLAKADDAIEVDSTSMDLPETTEFIWNLLKEKGLLGLPVIAVVGRPNVGKSTLINRFIGSREAIIADSPGVTRDRVSYETEWNGRRFVITDTGGWEPTPEGISIKITAAAEKAISQSDLIILVVDGQVGVLDEDDALIKVLRKTKKKIILVANKVDSEREEADAHSLWNLGLGEPHFVSAEHGRGSGDLLDVIVSALPEVGQSQIDDGYRRVAIVGRPNVGKSSLLNSLAGTERALVDDAEGTTRDPIDELIEFGGRTWRFIDTAGIRRRAHQSSGTDYYASLRTERAIESAEIVIMMIDASTPITEQDLRIITMIEKSGKALVIGMNKWDLVDADRKISVDKEGERNFDQVEWAERINLAAKTGWHKDRLAPALEKALESWEKRISTAKLNAFLGHLIGANPPPVRAGKQPKILFGTQAGIAPPKFVIFATGFLEHSYRRFIERRLREEFGFPGTPIEVAVRVRERG